MIVKDEALSIEKTLQSAWAAVDRFLVLDTGSSDDTVQLARAWMTRNNVRGTVVEEPFIACEEITDRKVIDFAKTRNRALKLAHELEPTKYTLFLSGDETFSGASELRERLQAGSGDAYSVMMRRGAKAWRYPRVLRTDGQWWYKFPIHEVPIGPNGETNPELVEGVFVDYAPEGDERLLERMRNVDVPVLNALVDRDCKTPEDHLSRERALMFLGQTHENLATAYGKDDPSNPRMTHLMLAMSYYLRHAAVASDEDDGFYSMFHYLDVSEKTDLFDHEELMKRYKDLAACDQRRPETHYKAAFHASQIDPRLAAPLAQEAARVAREAKTNPPAFSTDNRIEWLSLQILAESAKLLKYPERARRAAEEGLAAGGPREAFEEYLA